MVLEIVFLGMNEAGEKALEWLKNRGDISIQQIITEKQDLSQIKSEEPDLIISSGFEHKVPKEIIEVPDKGAVNLHPSYLPYNRGAHPYIWPLINGTPAGVSIHYMTERVDEGPIIARRKVEKKMDDNSKTLRNRLMDEQVDLLKDNWEKVLDGDSEPQNLEKGSVNKKNDLDQISELDLNQKMSLGEAINLLRALTYGDKKLGYFDKEGEIYNVGLEVSKEQDI